MRYLFFFLAFFVSVSVFGQRTVVADKIRLSEHDVNEVVTDTLLQNASDLQIGTVRAIKSYIDAFAGPNSGISSVEHDETLNGNGTLQAPLRVKLSPDAINDLEIRATGVWYGVYGAYSSDAEAAASNPPVPLDGKYVLTTDNVYGAAAGTERRRQN